LKPSFINASVIINSSSKLESQNVFSFSEKFAATTDKGNTKNNAFPVKGSKLINGMIRPMRSIIDKTIKPILYLLFLKIRLIMRFRKAPSPIKKTIITKAFEISERLQKSNLCFGNSKWTRFRSIPKIM
jgi:hypothetical protein